MVGSGRCRTIGMAVYSRVVVTHIFTSKSWVSDVVYLSSADDLRKVASGLVYLAQSDDFRRSHRPKMLLSLLFPHMLLNVFSPRLRLTFPIC